MSNFEHLRSTREKNDERGCRASLLERLHVGTAIDSPGERRVIQLVRYRLRSPLKVPRVRHHLFPEERQNSSSVLPRSRTFGLRIGSGVPPATTAP